MRSSTFTPQRATPSLYSVEFACKPEQTATNITAILQCNTPMQQTKMVAL
eukprot:m.1396009 g.1396009  ORF g.1396009 m.1396009 type:complete len:50 (-) comp24995_c0_seq5:1502-1651(-)